jgi:hypothetical protein
VKFLVSALFLLVLRLSLHAQQLTYQTLYVDYDSAVEFRNLKIIPIRPRQKGFGESTSRLISLNHALQEGLATVSERGTASTENVHYMRIRNASDQPIYVASGEIFSGGRQDRMVTRDTVLVPDGRDQYISVMCVEEGRWSNKERKFRYENFANASLRKVLDEDHNQVLIWQEVSRQLDSQHIRSKSLAYLSHNGDKKIVTLQNEYFNFFHDHFKAADSTIVGIVCMSGDKVIGADIFAGRNLFYNMLDPLLIGYTDQVIYSGKPVIITNEEVKKYMDKLLTDEISQEKFLRENGKIFRQNGAVIHINSF